MANKVGRPSSGKGKLLTIRLTPKMRYAVELIARIQRRNSITAVVEFALDRLVQDNTTGLIDGSGNFLLDLIYDEDEVRCFVNLGLYRPDLLTYDEELTWRAIESNKKYWRGAKVPAYDKIKAEWAEINNQVKLA